MIKQWFLLFMWMVLLAEFGFSQTLPWIQDDRTEAEWYSELKLRFPDSFSQFESYPDSWEKWIDSAPALNNGFFTVWNNELQKRYVQYEPSLLRINLIAYGTLLGSSTPVFTKNIRGMGYGGAWAGFGQHTVFSSLFQIDNDASLDPDYRGRITNVLNNQRVEGFLIHRHAYIKTQWDWFEAMAGKNKLSWGPTLTNSLILSQAAPPLDLIWFRYTAGPFRLTHFFSQLDYSLFKMDGKLLPVDTEIQRNLAGVRLESRLTQHLTAGISQTILFPTRTPGIRLVYLNPLVTYFGERENIGLSQLDDNINYGVDLAYRLPGLYSFSSVLIDDFSLDGKVNNKLGFQVGTEISDPVLPFPATLQIEFTKINPKVYTVKSTGGPLWLNYVFYAKMVSITEPDFSKGAILGNPIGPDAWQVFTRIKYWDFYPFRLETAILYQVLGKQNSLLTTGSPYKRNETRAFYEIKTGYEWTGWIVTSLFVQNRTTLNAGHFKPNTSDWIVGGKFEMDLGYSYRAGKTIF